MDDMVMCPECGRYFTVIWLRDGLGPAEYCPLCGEEIDYSQFELGE
jgi:rRNA maturation protein Nop10